MWFNKQTEEEKKQEEIVSNYKKDIYKTLYILQYKENWCKRSMAKNIEGEDLYNPYGKDVAQVCWLGALLRVEAKQETINFIEKNLQINELPRIDRFNDLNEYEDVIEFNLRLLHYLGEKIDLKKVEKIRKEKNV
jgi:hypothetical protein